MTNIPRTPKREIKKEALELLKHGKSRQESFELLVEKFKFTTDVADVLKKLPSSIALAKYIKWNNILLGIMFLTTLVLLLIAGIGPWLFWYGILIFVVAKRRFEYYIWISFISFILSAGMIVIFFRNYDESHKLFDMAFLLTLFLASGFLPFWLEKRLCPKPKESRIVYTDHQGRDKIKIVYEFSDL